MFIECMTHGLIRLSILVKYAAQYVLGYPNIQVMIFIDILQQEICHISKGVAVLFPTTLFEYLVTSTVELMPWVSFLDIRVHACFL